MSPFVTIPSATTTPSTTSTTTPRRAGYGHEGLTHQRRIVSQDTLENVEVDQLTYCFLTDIRDDIDIGQRMTPFVSVVEIVRKYVSGLESCRTVVQGVVRLAKGIM